MKQNDIKDATYSLSPQHYENIFNVYTNENGDYFYNLLKTVNFPSDLNSSVYDTYTVELGDTWPTISWRVYNSVFLWWIICTVNNIINPLDFPSPGTQLKILKPFYVQNVLNTISEQ